MVFLTPAAVADALGLTVKTLANWRSNGEGPSFVKIGSRVRYEAEAFEAWKRTLTA